MKKVISQEQKNMALDVLKYSDTARVEHLLRLDVFYIKDTSELIEWLPKFTSKAWDYLGVNIVYNGYSTSIWNDGTPRITELFFKTDKIVDLDDLLEIIADGYGDDDWGNISFEGIEYKTMVCDNIEDTYLDLDYHGSVDNYQDFYGFDDNEMIDIFGEEAEYYMSH